MINSTLRTALLKEHARDRRLTFINYAWMWILAAAVIYFAWPFIMNMLTEAPTYAKFALPIAFLFWIGYGIIDVVKINGRAQKIDEVSAKLQQGAKATNVFEHRDYKIKLPVFKLNIHLCPVDYCTFILNCNPGKTYCFPLHSSYVPDMKSVLSGASLEKVYEHISDIYSDNEVEYNAADDTPLKSVDEFRSFLTAELAGEVAALENVRKASHSSKNIAKVFAVFVVLAMVGFGAYYVFGGNFDHTADNSNTMFMFVGGLIVAIYAFYYIFMRPRQLQAVQGVDGATMATGTDYQFKNGIMTKMINFISPNTQYVMHGHISLEEFMASGMFNQARYDISGNDLIIGRHRGVPFQFCDLTVQVAPKVSYENEGPETVFYGQYFVARFNKSFSTPVYLVPRKNLWNRAGDGISGYLYHEGSKVELEDPEFMEMFHVYAGDQIEARYLLTPAMMERIKLLAKRTKSEYYVSFYNNKITVANNSGRNNFEINESKSILKDEYKVLTDFYSDMTDQFALIDDLKLNIKIWR